MFVDLVDLLMTHVHHIFELLIEVFLNLLNDAFQDVDLIDFLIIGEQFKGGVQVIP